MELEEFKSFFEDKLKGNNLNINIEYDKFYIYMKELLEWNEKINLTSIKDEKEFIVKHFIDSLTVAELFKGKKRIIDIGTGAGFPGIPLKLYNNELNVTLVDSVNKKVMVLKDIINKLNLDNIEAIHTRAEDLAQENNYREGFDIATSRAVSNLTTLVEYLLPFVKVGGCVVALKGPNYDVEVNDARKAIELLGGKVEKVISMNLDDEMERNIVIIKKVKETSKKYPRGQGLPLKKPLV